MTKFKLDLETRTVSLIGTYHEPTPYPTPTMQLSSYSTQSLLDRAYEIFGLTNDYNCSQAPTLATTATNTAKRPAHSPAHSLDWDS